MCLLICCVIHFYVSLIYHHLGAISKATAVEKFEAVEAVEKFEAVEAEAKAAAEESFAAGG